MKTTTIICPHCGQMINVVIDIDKTVSTSESEKEKKEEIERVKIGVEQDYGFPSSVSESEGNTFSNTSR